MLFYAEITAMYAIAHKRMVACHYYKLIIVFAQQFRKLCHEFAFGFTIAIIFNTGFIVLVQKPLAVENDHYYVFANGYFYRSGTAFAGNELYVFFFHQVYIGFLA